MASTTALFTGLSGLNAHARKLDVIGNNITNTNTTAFKGSRALFENMFSRTLGFGSAPDATLGGVNPKQIGFGVDVGAVRQDFTSGSLNATGDARDLSIDGEGFFMVQRGTDTFYTRAGAFRRDAEDRLVNPAGERLLGFGVDENFALQTGAIGDITVPIGQISIAEETDNVTLAGNLNKAGDLPSRGSVIELLGSEVEAPMLLSGLPINAGSPLTSIRDPDNPTSPRFSVGQTIRFTSGVTKGGGAISPVELPVAGGTTVQDLMTLIENALGIQDTGEPNPDGRTPGVSVDPTTGAITIVGNTGTENDIVIGSTDIELLDADGLSLGSAFEVNQAENADGESVRTTLSVFDSLGGTVLVDVVLTLEGTPDSGPQWRYYIESDDDTDASIAIGNGVVRYDTDGQLVEDTIPVRVNVDRMDTGADSPLEFDLRFASDSGRTTSLASASELIGLTDDGLPPGTLRNYSTAPDGLIRGIFSNGAERTLGQVAIAGFRNPGGLIDEGGNLFSRGPNAGPVTVTEPGTLGLGVVVAGALESSNVDLGREFTEMILTQTGYSASSRVIRTTDELFQQLLVLGR